MTWIELKMAILLRYALTSSVTDNYKTLLANTAPTCVESGVSLPFYFIPKIDIMHSEEDHIRST